jgi:hypothetical protein
MGDRLNYNGLYNDVNTIAGYSPDREQLYKHSSFLYWSYTWYMYEYYTDSFLDIV